MRLPGMTQIESVGACSGRVHHQHVTTTQRVPFPHSTFYYQESALFIRANLRETFSSFHKNITTTSIIPHAAIIRCHKRLSHHP
jgi:hypothetical protein